MTRGPRSLHFVGMRMAYALVFAMNAFAPTIARAQVLWEDYQGTGNITGSSNQDKPGPAYDNTTGGVTERLNALFAIAANPANTTRTGSSGTIDYLGEMCNTGGSGSAGYDPAGTGSACQADAMGRVAYALIKFPSAGVYQFEASHDDEMDLALSTNYTSTSYRTVTYNLPVGTKSWFTGETNFEYVGRVFSATANSCALLRIYWNNYAGSNQLRLRWDRPGTNDEIIPATQLLNPSQSSSATGCTGSVVAVGEITLTKSIAASGRAAAADQFTIATTDNSSGSLIASATTSGSGTGTQASTGVTQVGAGIVYALTDAMATGSTNALASYIPTIACTRNGTGFTPGGAAPTWTVSAAANDQIVCTITNTRQPPITVVKAVVPVFDPYNGVTNPKFIPGAGLDYTIGISNPGAVVSSNSLVIVDPLPSNVTLYVGDLSGGGTGPVVFVDGSPSSTLSYTFSGLASTTDDVDFSKDGGATWTYVPVPGGSGYDPLVTTLRIRPKGTMASGSSFTARFRLAVL